MIKPESTLLLISHPKLEKSTIHSALAEAALDAGITVRHIDDVRNDDGSFDIRSEQAVLESFDTIVLQFPMYWYATPAVLKQYLDDVLTNDWAYDGGFALQHKKLSVIITTGSNAESYSPAGEVGFTLDELSAPYKATAKFCGMTWIDPLFIYEASGADEEKVASEIANFLSFIG